MSKTNNGGPAFPRAGSSGPRGFGKPDNGMSLRDYFAAKAMQGLMSIYWEAEDEFSTADELVKSHDETAYEYADAMLKESEK